MSAWGIGASAITRRGIGVRRAGADPATVEPPVPSVDTLITWIPGEVLAAFAAAVAALQPEADTPNESMAVSANSLVVLIIGIAAAGCLTWLGGWSKVDNLVGDSRRELIFRSLLACVAFAIWSFVIPGSWWYSFPWMANNHAVVLIGVGFAGATFALLAEGIVRRIGA